MTRYHAVIFFTHCVLYRKQICVIFIGLCSQADLAVMLTVYCSSLFDSNGIATQSTLCHVSHFYFLLSLHSHTLKFK